MLKKIVIIICILFCIYVFLLPTMPISKPKYYTAKQIERLIKLAKVDDIDAIRKLFFYYTSNNNSSNVRLIECKMLQQEVANSFKLEVNILKNTKMECPSNPLELLEDNSFLNYLNYIWVTKKFPKE